MEETKAGPTPQGDGGKQPMPCDQRKLTYSDLTAMTRDELGHQWRELVGMPVPKSLSLPLMLRFVAFELQALQQGGLPQGFVEALTKTVIGAGSGRIPTARLRPGGRLLREWNGTTHVVDIVEGGFVWRGETHASLSAIAKEITGAHWSGPRFFGLTGPTGKARPGFKRVATKTARGAR